MSYELIITEKPSSALKIAQALADGKPVKKSSPQKVPYYEISHNGKDIIVASAVGHLFSVAEKKKGFTYPSFDIEWQLAADVSKGASFSRKYATLLKKLAKDANIITVATDYDIEGETIGYTIVKYLAKKPDANRMKFSTVTIEDLQEAYNNKLSTIDWGQAHAGETRHFLDWMYGINISRALTNSVKATGSFMLLSAGRVQGPALKIITDKEKEIQAFKPEDYWQIELQATKDKQSYSAWHKDDKIFDEKKAAQIHKKCQGSSAQVTNVDRKEYNQPAPNPFDLGSLQTESFRCFNIKPKETLEHAQNLYSAGYISYPRTSSQQLDPKLGFQKVLKGLAKQEQYAQLANNLLAQKTLKPNNGKKTDPAHPAIYPTGYVPKQLGTREAKVYDLIVKRFLATFAKAAKRERMTITINCQEEEFVAKGARTVEPNWHEYYKPYVKIKEEQLPKLQEQETITQDELILHKKQTSPPKRYTQSSIITELEKRGLGTKATRADIVENLFKRGYVEGQSITATDLGLKISDALEKALPEIVDVELTRHFEEELQEIRDKKKEPQVILDQAKKTLTTVLGDFKKKEKELGTLFLSAHREYEDEKNTLGPCTRKGCSGELKILFSKKNKSRFVGCSNYPECNVTYTIPQSGLVSSTEKACPVCPAFLIKVQSRGKAPQEVCINPECPSRRAPDGVAQEKPCPKCKGTLKLRKGVYGAFYGCSNYPKCKHTEQVKKEE